LQVGPQRPAQHGHLEIAAPTGEGGHVVPMADTGDVLLDDRALVETSRDVVRRGADDLDAPGGGLAGGACGDEGGQERVVDVDDAAGPAVDEPGGEDQHVAGQHD